MRRKNAAKWRVTRWQKHINIIVLCKGMLLETYTAPVKVQIPMSHIKQVGLDNVCYD